MFLSLPADHNPAVNVTLRSVVRSAPVPVTASMSYAGGEFAMTWTGTWAVPVDVGRRVALDAGVWEGVVEGVTTGQFTDENPPAGRGFHRVVVP